MLVLSRGANESIRIGADVRVVMLGLRHGKARLGIEAPPGVPIVREELPPLAHAGIVGRANSAANSAANAASAAGAAREIGANGAKQGTIAASANHRCSEQSAAPVAGGERGAAEAHNLGAAGSIPAAAS